MPRASNKEALVQEIRDQRSRLEKNISLFSEEELVRPGAVGDWSIKDVMAHLADWEQRFIAWYKAGRRGEVPPTPAPGLSWHQLDFLNRQIFERYKDRPLAEVRALFGRSYCQVVDLIAGMTEEELFTPGFYLWNEYEPLSNWAADNTSNHYAWAKTQIRKTLKSKREEPGP